MPEIGEIQCWDRGRASAPLSRSDGTAALSGARVCRHLLGALGNVGGGLCLLLLEGRYPATEEVEGFL
jgi:hypothetical protein